MINNPLIINKRRVPKSAPLVFLTTYNRSVLVIVVEAISELLTITEALDRIAADAVDGAADTGDLFAIDLYIAFRCSKLVAVSCNHYDPMLRFDLSIAVVRGCIDHIPCLDLANTCELGAGNEIVAAIDVFDKVGAVSTASAGSVGGQFRLTRIPGGPVLPAGILNKGVHSLAVRLKLSGGKGSCLGVKVLAGGSHHEELVLISSAGFQFPIVLVHVEPGLEGSVGVIDRVILLGELIAFGVIKNITAAGDLGP